MIVEKFIPDRIGCRNPRGAMTVSFSFLRFEIIPDPQQMHLLDLNLFYKFSFKIPENVLPIRHEMV